MNTHCLDHIIRLCEFARDKNQHMNKHFSHALVVSKPRNESQLKCVEVFAFVSHEAMRFGYRLFKSLWNLTGTQAAALSRCMSNFRMIRHPISRLRDFSGFGSKTSYRWVNRGPAKSGDRKLQDLSREETHVEMVSDTLKRLHIQNHIWKGTCFSVISFAYVILQFVTHRGGQNYPLFRRRQFRYNFFDEIGSFRCKIHLFFP